MFLYISAIPQMYKHLKMFGTKARKIVVIKF